jgi:anti-sigma B factor antagonist
MTTLCPSFERHVAGPTRFEIRMQRDDEVVYVEPAGELDLATSATLHNRVDALMATDAQQVIIDLRRLTFIDCAGVRALLALDGDARRHGTQLSLIQGENPVRRIFALTATLDALPFTEAPRP